MKHDADTLATTRAAAVAALAAWGAAEIEECARALVAAGRARDAAADFSSAMGKTGSVGTEDDVTASALTEVEDQLAAELRADPERARLMASAFASSPELETAAAERHDAAAALAFVLVNTALDRARTLWDATRAQMTPGAPRLWTVQVTAWVAGRISTTLSGGRLSTIAAELECTAALEVHAPDPRTAMKAAGARLAAGDFPTSWTPLHPRRLRNFSRVGAAAPGDPPAHLVVPGENARWLLDPALVSEAKIAGPPRDPEGRA